MFSPRDAREPGEVPAPPNEPEMRSSFLFEESVRLFGHYQVGAALSLVRQAIEAVDRAIPYQAGSSVAARDFAASLLVRNGEFFEAERCLSDAIDIISRQRFRPDAAVLSLYVRKGEALTLLGHLDEAARTLGSATALAAMVENSHELRGRLVLAWGLLGAERGHPRAYRETLGEAMRFFRRTRPGEYPDVARTLMEASAAHEDRGRFMPALMLAERARRFLVQSEDCDPDVLRLVKLHIGEMAHKAGNFGRAKVVRSMLLAELVASTATVHGADGEDDEALALAVRQSLAQSHAELSEFEAAELHFTETISKARSIGERERAHLAAEDLLGLYVSRGLEEEAQRVRACMREISRELDVAGQLLSEVDGAILERLNEGDFSGALESLGRVSGRLNELSGLDRDFCELSMLATKAYILAEIDPSESREVLQGVLGRLAELPAQLAQQLQVKVVMTRALLAVEEGNPAQACAITQDFLLVLERAYGNSCYHLKLVLLGKLVDFQEQAGETEAALSSARAAVSMQQRHNDTQSEWFARNLQRLAHLLPPESAEEADTLIERARAILESRNSGGHSL